MYATITHFKPISKIHKKRVLPSPGKLLVRKGQKVNATDVVAYTTIDENILIINIAQGLGMFPETAMKYINLDIGSIVEDGDILAGPIGITQRVIRAPCSGNVVFIDHGQVFLKTQGKAYDLYAGMTGTVIELIEDIGVVISSTGLIIQGVWGNNMITSGPLFSVMKSPDDELLPQSLDARMNNTVVLGGYCRDQQVLRTAEKLSLRGLILASIDSSLINYASGMKIPIISIEGFGKITLNQIVYTLLTTNEQREVTVCAEQMDRLRGIRPEISIPLPGESDLSLLVDCTEYQAGQRVRITRSPYQGLIGEITHINPGKVTIGHSCFSWAGSVKFEDGRVDTIPLSNLEVVI